MITPERKTESLVGESNSQLKLNQLHFLSKSD